MTSSTRVLVISRSWTLDREQPATLAAIRERLHAVGAELLVLCGTGVWSFHDGTVDHSDRMVGDGATVAMLHGARHRGDAVFVADGASVVRMVPSSSDLIEKLDAAAELVAVRAEAAAAWSCS